MADWISFLEEYGYQIYAIVLVYFVSQYLSEIIAQNYVFVETVLLILIFGIISEIWNGMDKGELLDDIISVSYDLFGKTGAQVGLILAVGSVVYSSMVLRHQVEHLFGPLAVIQLIAIVVILSRAFIDLHVSATPVEIFDYQKDTYAIYTASILAIITSYMIRDYYPVWSEMHNNIVLFSSIFAPLTIFYLTNLGEEFLPVNTEPSS